MTDDGGGFLAGHSFASWEASGIAAVCRVIEITFHYLHLSCNHHIALSETIVMFQLCAHDFAPFNRFQMHAFGGTGPFETPA